jgi:hypothetical protein
MIGTTRRIFLAAVATSALVIIFFAVGCSTGSWKTSHGPSFNGTIQTVDLASHLLTVAPLKSGSAPMVFRWDDRSRFWANGGLRIEPQLLEARDSVRIHYQADTTPWIVQHLYLETYRTIH